MEPRRSVAWNTLMRALARYAREAGNRPLEQLEDEFGALMYAVQQAAASNRVNAHSLSIKAVAMRQGRSVRRTRAGAAILGGKLRQDKDDEA